MKKKYEEPKAELIRINSCDVQTDSIVVLPDDELDSVHSEW